MIAPPHPPAPLILNWFERHPTLLNRVIHWVGIPPTIIGIFLVPIWLFLISIPLFLLAVGLFVGGYLIQFFGHLLEGTPSGEMTYLRTRFRRSRLAALLGVREPEPSQS